MHLLKLKQKLKLMGLHLRASHHHSWVVYLQKSIPHSKLSKEIDCAEISTQYQSYFVNKPTYLSHSAISAINSFAGTPANERNDSKAPAYYYVLLSRTRGYSVQVWYFNAHHKVASRIGENTQQFIYNSRYHLTKTNLISIENYLLAHGIGQKSLTVKPLIEEK